jgi:crossover junction endodeoxyribonuclease RusA
MTTIMLPWPPASLSGHAGGHWRSKSSPTAKHREWARLATLAAHATAPATGDIRVHIRFVPPDRRGDRTNFPNRMKAYLDGIAEAMDVNDSRFLPSYEFAEPVKPGRVEVEIEPYTPPTEHIALRAA